MDPNILINLARDKTSLTVASTDRTCRLYTPGEVVSPLSDFMRGHGTYPEDDQLKASVAGIKEEIGRLICVKPLKARYNGEVGDVVVGRITEVTQKRWKVDTNSRLDSNLLLSSVNLPGGELRRRSAEDEQMMRKYLVEGDLISAEVQSIFQDGSLSLHTRSFTYGKLSQGILIKVYPALIKRCKTHFHHLPFGASVILGMNGFIWICPSTSIENDSSGGFTQDLEEKIPKPDREVIARLRNCILALAASKIPLYDTTITYAYEESMKYEDLSDLLNPEAMLDIAILTQQRRLQMMDDS
ncbi:exosome complex component RRP4 [Planococcus citri]|uniref:exosome complex component RRP4 n=1 Tax=Planococcus citri TaxID=170843 RepID=UPI0031F85B55